MRISEGRGHFERKEECTLKKKKNKSAREWMGGGGVMEGGSVDG